MLDLKQIQYFVACAQTGSFSKAAESLFTTQSNVSKVIRSMEQEMETKLFERYAKGIMLTPSGEHVYKHASQILEGLRKLEQVEDTRQIDTLRISVNPSSWFADQFVQFYQQYQMEKVHYQVYSAHSQEIVERIHERIDDIGFTYVMKNQMTAFQYFLTRNYLEFIPLTETGIVIYYASENDYWKDPLKKIRFSEMKLIQRYADEFSPDNYWEIQDESGNSASNAEAVITTNSDYIMERLLKVSNLSNISCGYLSGDPWRVSAEGIPLSGNEKQVVYGYIKRQNEELSTWSSLFVEFIKQKI